MKTPERMTRVLGRRRRRRHSVGDMRSLAQSPGDSPPVGAGLPPQLQLHLIGDAAGGPHGTPRAACPTTPGRIRPSSEAKWGGVEHALEAFRHRSCSSSFGGRGSADEKQLLPGGTTPEELPAAASVPPPSVAPRLLPGDPPEEVCELTEGVTFMVPPLAWGQGPGSVLVEGTLRLTTYRLLFTPSSPCSSRRSFSSVDIPLMSILRVSTKLSHPSALVTAGNSGVAVLKVQGKDPGRVLRFLFGRFTATTEASPPAALAPAGPQQGVAPGAKPRRGGGTPGRYGDGAAATVPPAAAAGGPATPSCYAEQPSRGLDCAAFSAALVTKLQRLLDGLDLPFAYSYRGAVTGTQSKSWGGYDPAQEYKRQGAIGAPFSTWKLSPINRDWDLCPSLPARLCVPRLVDEKRLRGCAAFRSKGRLPILSWHQPTSGACIVRCAQPLPGLLGARSAEDERYLELIAAASSCGGGGLAGGPVSLHIMDARKFSAAAANRGRGGGYEDVSRYSRCNGRGEACWRTTISFAGIDNIHVMRASLDELQGLYRKGRGEWACTPTVPPPAAHHLPRLARPACVARVATLSHVMRLTNSHMS
jgi:hypothetical protein